MNDNNKHPVMYLSYLLRLWRTGDDHPWKASLEDPRIGQRMGFPDLEALLIYLREQTSITLDTVRDEPGER